MMVIGIDPHKSTHTATAVDPHTNRATASLRIDANLGEYRRLMRWARQFEQRRWAVENAEGLGRHLSTWLLARGEQVVDVPTTATARVRQLSRGGGRKNDQIDAAAAASVAALQGESRPLEPEGVTDALALLDESRMNLAQSRVRLVNQLHALLRELVAGGAPRDLSASTAAALLRRVRPAGDVERVRKQIAAGLVAQIRSVDALLKSNATQISERVAASGSTDRHRRHRRDHRRPPHRPHRPRQPVPQLCLVRQLRRRSTSRSRQCRQSPPPPLPQRRSPTQRRTAHRGDHPDSNTGQPRTRLLQRQGRRGQNRPRSTTLPETTSRRPHLAHHDHRRTASGGEPGRTLGGGSDIQRGWLNPDHQPFGEVTSRARQAQFYDLPPSRLTNTEAPKGTDLSVHSEADLDWVAAELNDRPRKRLAFKKPIEQIGPLLLR